MDKKEARASKGSTRRTVALLASYLADRKGLVAGLAVAILASNALMLVNPLVLRSFIDAIVAGERGLALYRYAFVYIAMAFAVQGFAILATRLGQDLGWRATNALRMDLLERVMSMDMSYHKEHLPGELVERVDGDAKMLMSFFSDFAIRLFGSAVLMVGILVTLFAEDARVGSAMAGFAAFAAVFLMKIGGLAVPAWKRNREKAAEFFGFLGERLGGREDIRSLGAVDYTKDKLRRILRDWFPIRLKANILGYTMWMSSEFAAGIGTILSLGLGAALWATGAVSLGTVYLIYSYSELIRRPLEQLREQIEELQKALAGTSRILGMLEQRPDMAYGEERFARASNGARPAALRLEFRDVSFSYEKGKNVISGLSFTLPPGSSLGVIGRTGCGKTTLGRLALRLYDCDSGEVRLDGKRVGDYSSEALRDGLAVVTQDVEIFSATIRDNARLWDPGIGDDRILAAFGALGLDAWLSGFPSGLDERIGSGGVGMSAGQAQLLAMVRVFLREPGLVILDEASSRLDPATETLIDGAVSRLLSGRSAIIIAHRLSTLDRVDAILAMDGGVALEYGKRAELAANPDSRYARLLRAGKGDMLGTAAANGKSAASADADIEGTIA